jgi:hypothetical protein
VYDAIRQPSQKIQRGKIMGGEDIAKVGSVEDILQRGKYSDPYRRPVFGGNKTSYTMSALRI